MASFFHAYDLRGTYPDQISEEEAKKVGKAYGTFTRSDTVIVGRDGRNHSEKVKEAFVSGITSTGVGVLDAGMVPSPVVYLGSMQRGLPCAVVTASHNPPKYTGFKFMKEGAIAMSRETGMKMIEEIYESEDFDSGRADQEQVDLKEDYVGYVKERVDLEKELEVAVNYGNGVTPTIAGGLLEEIGCEIEEVNEEIDGDFPNHLPAPGESEAQQQLMDQMSSEELGIIFDGDGDRAGFIVSGEYVPEDEVISVFASEILERKRGTVVHDLRASKLVKETIEQHGGTAEESRVGHTFISQRIFEDDTVVFAGELSGHYYFPALEIPFDDGLFAAALMCEIASKGDLEDRLESMPEYPVSPELRIDCPRWAKQEVVEEVERHFSGRETSNLDGVKVSFEKGWALVRPSNTEPKISVRCEADDEGSLEEILEEVEKTVRSAIDSRKS